MSAAETGRAHGFAAAATFAADGDASVSEGIAYEARQAARVCGFDGADVDAYAAAYAAARREYAAEVTP